MLFSSEDEALTDCVSELLQKWRAQAERTTFGQAWAARNTDYFIYRFPDPSTAGAMLELALSGCPLRCEFAPNPCYDTVSWGSAPMIDLRRPKVPTEPLYFDGDTLAIGECAVFPGEASYAARSSTHFRVVRGPDEDIHLCSLNSICHQDFQYIGTRGQTREWRSFRERDEIDLERVAQLVPRMSTTAMRTTTTP